MRRGEIRSLTRRLRSAEVTLLRMALRIEALEHDLGAARLALAIMGLDVPPEESLPTHREPPPLRLVGGTEAGRMQEEGRPRGGA